MEKKEYKPSSTKAASPIKSSFSYALKWAGIAWGVVVGIAYILIRIVYGYGESIVWNRSMFRSEPEVEAYFTLAVILATVIAPSTFAIVWIRSYLKRKRNS